MRNKAIGIGLIIVAIVALFFLLKQCKSTPDNTQVLIQKAIDSVAAIDRPLLQRDSIFRIVYKDSTSILHKQLALKDDTISSINTSFKLQKSKIANELNDLRQYISASSWDSAGAAEKFNALNNGLLLANTTLEEKDRQSGQKDSLLMSYINYCDSAGNVKNKTIDTLAADNKAYKNLALKSMLENTPRTQVWWGIDVGSGSGYSGAGLQFLLKNKQDEMFNLGADVLSNGKVWYHGGMNWKIKIGKQ